MRRFLAILAVCVAMSPWGASSSAAFAQAQQAVPAQPASAPQPAAPAPKVANLRATPGTATTQTPGYAAQESCALCHDAEAKGFGSNPHGKLAQLHGGKGVTCEGCHGPGQAHVDSGGDKTKIFDFKTATEKQATATCLGCHAAAHPNFLRSPHAKADVGCTSCHSVHSLGLETGTRSPDAQAKLLKAEQPALCYQCHTDVKPAFSQPFHHKVNEGLVKCSDCHNTHGTFGNNNIKSTADQNAVCTKCHTETRGPFVFEHATVKGEGCLGCHTPHGSQNARLMNVPNVNQLCNQCHSPAAAATIHGLNAGSADAIPCVSCHTMIHGSNINPAFLRE